ncbi:hypothetical protein C8F04DRAFT_1105008 [Mycena alexandri]|uniref:Uncharacterized protein n=1 Tax=Mycena alexandri TaxID=1745969 RepID=A0AAD6SS13_9AGAR|nr:hypothetical protein C8F04DRAFT_1167017 [Mycena alexandri]KAJ7019148.1 hypothetical protein C8F04DRAFT_1148772 [Mycena alexandri]KAJ7031465.1 hypothetical protein C8F04DRAFT_1110340 [Mycena alexandri]KAJ7033253.1 hypothetical protein C8F04DRAFT_1105008 [Mycena alexandri]
MSICARWARLSCRACPTFPSVPLTFLFFFSGFPMAFLVAKRTPHRLLPLYILTSVVVMHYFTVHFFFGGLDEERRDLEERVELVWKRSEAK